jgi:hypothetical protein
VVAGQTAFDPAALRSMRPAIQRLAKSLARAVAAVPAVNKFFNDELGPILSM